MTKRLLLLVLLLMFFLNVQQTPNLTTAANLDQPWEYTTEYNVRSVAISHDGQNVAVGTEYPHASIYYLTNGKLLWKYDIRGSSVYGLDISADGEYIVAVGNKVRFLTRGKRVLWEYDIPTTVISAEMTPNAEYIAVGAYNGVYLFSKNGEVLWHYPFEPSKTRSVYVAITPDGKYIAATSLIEHDGSYVYLFSRDGDLIWRKKVSNSFVLSVDISDDGKYLAVGLDSGWFLLNRWGDILYTNSEIRGWAIAISKDNQYIAVRDTRKVYIFDIKGSKVGGYKPIFC
ncbi:MAG TPA: WD40 repeat domain-containing protein [Euryarchaeota archaeon]|nr:WD40 repeat domain-containing protein [Euryarchaeota archaeon]